MTTERAQELQEHITKEAIAMLVIHGNAVDTASYEHGVELVGSAWGVPGEETERWLSLIDREREAVSGTDAPVRHVFPEAELPMNASGMETLDNIWGLFETAVQLDGSTQRMALLRLAHELEETQNLLDWIQKMSAERELPDRIAV